MNVFLTTLGCRLNEAEIATWSRGFQRAGHRVVRAPDAAHVMVLNTCAVTSEAARKSRKHVAALHRKNPDARLVVTGCFAELEPERAAGLAGVDLVVGNGDKDALVDRVTGELDVGAMPALAAEPEGSHVYRESRTRAFVKVQDGCRNRCTFCIVTIARGREKSRPVAELVDEVNALARDGYREAVLTGVHLGGYGRDLDTDLQALVRALVRDTDMPRLRLSSLEPWDLPPDFAALWDSPRLMPHVHLPLQSGSDAVLRRMARRCDTATYARLVRGLRRDIPDLTVTTDVIVGFPGETDDEWAETLEFVREVGFGHIHIFTYSRREGTTAARLPGHVATDVKRARSRELHALAAAHKAEHLGRFTGAERPVLWEGSGEPIPGGGARWLGYTDNYLRVEMRGGRGDDLGGRIVPVHLERVAGEPADRLIGAPARAAR